MGSCFHSDSSQILYFGCHLLVCFRCTLQVDAQRGSLHCPESQVPDFVTGRNGRLKWQAVYVCLLGACSICFSGAAIFDIFDMNIPRYVTNSKNICSFLTIPCSVQLWSVRSLMANECDLSLLTLSVRDCLQSIVLYSMFRTMQMSAHVYIEEWYSWAETTHVSSMLFNVTIKYVQSQKCYFRLA